MKPLPLAPLAISIILASASAFAPSPIAPSIPPSQTTALYATTGSRRELLQNGLAAFSFLALGAAPSLANAATDAASYAASVERSTNALSRTLGHAVLVVDGMNAQARRLGSSRHPAHPVAVLEGMGAQARRLTRDLDESLSLLDEIKGQAKDITINDEKFSLVVGSVAHASSVLDGMAAQSKRLEGALSLGGSANTDDQIIYMLSILDGLNAQVRRLDMGETFGVLDELNAKASMALL
mmetsp:Transcript_40026/g.85215  ORF Transcript_40026/g.85215 Transcript_40026/m.85215 type:complete len:239 (-) Transcript_40026:474-1190(-)|eukprot:CAMPEP_0172531812 /NCGR_PEP_ID=MMETSP1067-20121228/5066_1 /TAXON_ID=265564 ORGANISM="Thalassiosira punctigera, Strain Tpunct2005C2" /NCGR_SAMPLE_ID=MMETSP1067 /ASSEMBLY_ACC=CAM_ASM_000444 /LENGTH=238 /DNA_ID=CAMNT_0013316241 /DNA_START=56 /DNA_END=772 /DNA_ORIENTATION=-